MPRPRHTTFEQKISFLIVGGQTFVDVRLEVDITHTKSIWPKDECQRKYELTVAKMRENILFLKFIREQYGTEPPLRSRASRFETH